MIELIEHVENYIAGVLEREAGYVDHKDDRGGKTNWGITEFVARAYGYEGHMRDLPKETARNIYRERYWLAPKLDLVHAQSPMLAEKLLDIGVNMGQSRAISFMQRALNVLNMQGTLFPDMKVDGTVGNVTLYALKVYLQRRAKLGELTLWRMVNGLQSTAYIEFAEAKPSQESFEFGWQANRVQGSPT